MNTPNTKSAGVINTRFLTVIIEGFKTSVWPNAYKRMKRLFDLIAKVACIDKACSQTLPGMFINRARIFWFKKCIADNTQTPISYGKTLAGSVALSKKLKAFTTESDNIGILLPPSTASAIVNIAAGLLGKVAVNLNYTVSEHARNYAVSQCGLTCIISSKQFIEKTDLISPKGTVFIEDIVSQITLADKIIAFLQALLYPTATLISLRTKTSNTPAAIMYSSGSTGEPKGVVLSHKNILSNIDSLEKVLNVDHTDDLCAVLPMFHSFGFTCGLWLPISVGASITFTANPLDTKLVAKSVAKHKSTVLFAPPSILGKYVKRVSPSDFASLRIVAAGAEKLTPQLADAFYQRFGIRLYHGYGATELSPVAALNMPDSDGCNIDSVGRPLPGISVRVVDPDTKEILPAGVPGLIEIKGPNVMLGYLDEPTLTESVMTDGWYNTGDIGHVDAKGFITITDRLARFSKIAGEMIPHVEIERVLLDGLNTHEQIVAVTAIADKSKAEQLIVLYTDAAGSEDTLRQIINSSRLPNIFRPKNNKYIKIEKLPFLGSGKLDIMRLRKIAIEKSHVCRNL